MSSGDVVLARTSAVAASSDILDSAEAAQRVIRGGAVRTGVYLLAAFANLAVLPLLFRHLGVEDSGRYVTVLTVATLVGAVVESGFGAISVREFARRGAVDRQVLMGDLIALRATTLLLCGVLALGFLAVAGYPGVIIAGTAVAVVGVFFEALSSTYSVWLAGSLHLGRMAVLQVVRQAVAVVLTVVLIWLDAPLLWFFALLVVAGIAQAGGAVYLTRGAIPHLPSRDWSGARTLLRRSAPFVAAMALGVLYFRIAMILMPVLSSETETGHLGIPFRLLEIVTLISVLLLSSAFPIVARAAGSDRARHRHALWRLSQVAVIAGLLTGVIAVVGAPLIVEVLGGRGFEPATGLLRVLAISLAAKFLIAAWAFSLLSLDRHVAVLRANAAAAVLAVALTLALVPSFDASGGAWATAAADVALLIGYGWALRSGPDPVDLRWRQVLPLVAAAAVALAALALPLPVLGQTVVACAVFASVLWLSRLLPSELVDALPAALRRR